jgi:hypothetical protein
MGRAALLGRLLPLAPFVAVALAGAGLTTGLLARARKRKRGFLSGT